MDYTATPFLYWAEPRKGRFISVRKVAGSRPDQDGLINTDKGMVPESLLVPDCLSNRQEMALYAEMCKHNTACSMRMVLSATVQRMKLRTT